MPRVVTPKAIVEPTRRPTFCPNSIDVILSYGMVKVSFFPACKQQFFFVVKVQDALSTFLYRFYRAAYVSRFVSTHSGEEERVCQCQNQRCTEQLSHIHIKALRSVILNNNILREWSANRCFTVFGM